jgi:hypothetical protein
MSIKPLTVALKRSAGPRKSRTIKTPSFEQPSFQDELFEPTIQRQTEFGESLIPLPLPTSTPVATLHENGLKPGTVEQVYNGDAHYVDMNMENAAREEARRRQHKLAPRADYTKLQAYLREAQAEQEPQPIPEEESTQDTIQAQSQQEPQPSDETLTVEDNEPFFRPSSPSDHYDACDPDEEEQEDPDA